MKQEINPIEQIIRSVIPKNPSEGMTSTELITAATEAYNGGVENIAAPKIEFYKVLNNLLMKNEVHFQNDVYFTNLQKNTKSTIGISVSTNYRDERTPSRPQFINKDGEFQTIRGTPRNEFDYEGRIDARLGL